MSLAIHQSASSAPSLSRVELYRLLGDGDRLRLLALCAEETLSVGELATLLDDGQPQVSRKLGPLRQAGLIGARRDGNRTLLSTQAGPDDSVLAEAIAEGRRLCFEDGSLAKLPGLLARREARGDAFFAGADDAAGAPLLESTGDLAAHLSVLAPLLPGHGLAVDAGTGDGQLIELLAPLYERVVAVDKSPARLARCAQRVEARGFAHVSLYQGAYDDVGLVQRVDDGGGADLVFASRALHHASRPRQAVHALARLLKRGGHLALLDYLPHTDETLREKQGDVWLGFAPAELRQHLTEAGLVLISEKPVPAHLHREGPDAHLGWQALVARKPHTRSSQGPSALSALASTT